MMVKNMDKILETTLNATADTRIKVGLLGSLAIIYLYDCSNFSCNKSYVLTGKIFFLSIVSGQM
jgi:hypothetical protein